MIFPAFARMRGLFFCFAVALAAPSTAQALDLHRERKPVAMPAFQLEAHSGAPFGVKQLRDRWSLVLIGYTYCPDICPMALAELNDVLASFTARHPGLPLPQIVFVGVDPERDREILPSYVASFHPAMVGVTGRPAEIDKLVAAIRGFYKLDPKDADGNYLVQHSASISVIDDTGHMVARVNPPLDPDATADLIRTLMQEG